MSVIQQMLRLNNVLPRIAALLARTTDTPILFVFLVLPYTIVYIYLKMHLLTQILLHQERGMLILLLSTYQINKFQNPFQNLP